MKVKHLLFSIIAAAFLSSAIPVDNKLEVGRKAPKIETIQGTNVGYDANSENKRKLVSFWTAKKPSSRIANRKLGQKYGKNDDNVEFISICTDSDEVLMNEVMKLDGLDSDKSYSKSEINPRVFKDYDVEDNPRAFFIDSNGKILDII